MRNWTLSITLTEHIKYRSQHSFCWAVPHAKTDCLELLRENEIIYAFTQTWRAHALAARWTLKCYIHDRWDLLSITSLNIGTTYCKDRQYFDFRIFLAFPCQIHCAYCLYVYVKYIYIPTHVEYIIYDYSRMKNIYDDVC